LGRRLHPKIILWDKASGKILRKNIIEATVLTGDVFAFSF
jgi:hypothetical protein